LSEAATYLERRGVSSPRLSAECLLGKVLDLERINLYVNFDRPLTRDELAAYRSLLKRRAAGEPLQYITGEVEFFDCKLRVDPRVFIPRPETEQLVENILELLAGMPEPPGGWRIADVGTGSGAIAVALAVKLERSRVFASDISRPALELAECNARVNGVDSRISFLAGDLFRPFSPGDHGRFDLIVSNPPYVAEAEFPGLPREVRDFEPRVALVGGPAGSEILAEMVAAAPEFLKPGGIVALEIGDNQGARVARMLLEDGRYNSVRVEKDYAGRDRMVFARGVSIA